MLLLTCVACGAGSNQSLTTLAVPGRANANVSLAADGEFIAAAWSASEAGGSMDIYLSISDNGETFSPPVRVNAMPGEGRVNGEQPPRIALVPRPEAGKVHVVWLDHRRLAADSKVESTHRHGSTTEPAGDSAGMAQLSDLYVATLDDQTAHTIEYRLRNAAGAGRNDGFACGHGFRANDRQSFVAA